MEPKHVLTHFQSINRSRIERLRELAPKSQQAFFDLLALLFHINSKDLPVYISDDTPAGIVDYQPSDIALDVAQSINPQFNFTRRPLRRYPILGAYLINNNGSLNYQENAEYELWLVHIDDAKKVELLQDKLTAIELWAKSLGVTLHSRLLSEQSVTEEVLSADDLNRFYLNGLVFAGSIPLWWMINPEQEASNYTKAAQILTQQKLLGHTSILDFGSPSEADAQVLYCHAATLLLNAIEQGLDHVVNLQYSQLQLNTFPQTEWLCHQLKEAIYQGEKDLLALDPHVLKLQAILNSPLLSDDQKLFAQQSLYVLFNERLSQRISHAQDPVRRHFIKQYSSTWQWPQHIVQVLDQRNKAHYRQCLTEFQQVITFHNHVKQDLNAFALKFSLDTEEDTPLIDKKQALFQDLAPDIIPYLPNALLPSKTKERVYLYRFKANGEWLISDLSLQSADEQPLYKAQSLLNVIAWAIRNHILSHVSQLNIADQTNLINPNVVIKLVQALLRTPLSTNRLAISNSTLEKPPEIDQLMLFINLEHAPPQDKLTQQGIVRSSLQNDPLSHALTRQNLVFGVEGLIYSSWGQWHYFSHTGKTAVLDMINTLLLWHPIHNSGKLSLCWCPSEAHGQAIERRVTKLYNDVVTHYQSSSQCGDYLVSLSEKIYLIQWQIGACDYTSMPNGQNIHTILASARTQFSSTKVDSYLDPSGLFAQLLRLQSPHQLTLFLSSKKESVTLYILDEQGTLFHQNFMGLTESTLTSHFYRFLTTIKQKNNIKHLRFYRLTELATGAWKLSAMPLSKVAKQDFLPVTIEMASIENDAQCTIHCGKKKFSGKADESTLFQQVNELVLRFRRSSERYPLYITDITFPQDIQVSNYHYIRQKQRLEHLLNNE